MRCVIKFYNLSLSYARCLFISYIFLFIPNLCYATNFYLSPTGNDSGDGSIGQPWKSLNHALNRYANNNINARVGPGDTLYLRGGVYQIPEMSVPGGSYPSPIIALNTNIISARTVIKSYPGEWAILDGGGTHWALEAHRTQYNITFEDMEIRNGFRWGFRFGDGYEDRFLVNGIFRNLYFHDNTSADVNHNPAGMQLSGDSCIIEYCTFKDNGTPGSTHNNNANLILYNDYDYYPESTPRKNNIIRYNVFDGAGSGLKDKGDSNFVNSKGPNTNNAGWALDVHHNIFMNSVGRAYWCVSDFTRFHHNLIIDARQGIKIEGMEQHYKSIWYVKIYNNTFVGLDEWAIAIANAAYDDINGAFGHNIHSNIVYNCTANAFLFWTGQTAHNYTVTSDYNFWHNNVSTVARRQLDTNASLNTWKRYGYGAHSAIGAVSFIDSGNNDYRLTGGSAGKNAGQDGNDAGAFGTTNWYDEAGSKQGKL